MNNRDDNASTWRDIADQLTPDQRAELEQYEHAGDEPSTLVFFARDYAAQNMADAVMFGDVEPPVDAVHVHGWQSDSDEVWFREFECATRTIAHTELRVVGRQFADGRCEGAVLVIADDSETLTPALARALATALCDAAVEADSGG